MHLNQRMRKVEGNLYGVLAGGQSPLYISETAEMKPPKMKLWQKKAEQAFECLYRNLWYCEVGSSIRVAASVAVNLTGSTKSSRALLLCCFI